MDIKLQKSLSFFYLAKNGIFDYLSELLSFLYIKIYITAILFLNIVSWFASYRFNKDFGIDPEQQATLHYNVDFGAKYISDAKEIFSLPRLGLVIFFINLFLLFFSEKASKNKKFSRHLVMSATIFFQIILLISIVSLYIVNLNQ